MIPGNEDGKIGFLITLAALIGLMISFGLMALTGGSETLMTAALGSAFIALIGHFMLDGAKFRKKMLAEKKKKKEKKRSSD